MTTVKVSGGLEVGLGGVYALNQNDTNSGTLQLNTMLLRNAADQWTGWPQPLTQIDQPCGVVPCLQGYWATTTPPWDNWNNGQPSQ